MPAKFRDGERVALKENTAIRGKVRNSVEAQLPLNEASKYWMPTVRWDDGSEYSYLEEVLMYEKDLPKLEKERVKK